MSAKPPCEQVAAQEEAKEMLRLVIADEELFRLGAKVMGMARRALIEEGFTPEEAANIIAHQGAGVGTDETS